jgi:cytoskeletal protein CcmA (bactofilin family)
MGYMEIQYQLPFVHKSPLKDLVVRDYIYGDVNARSIKVEPEGYVDGNITAQLVVSRGKIRGNIDANSVSLRVGSDTVSEITSTMLEVDNDAAFIGECHIRPEASGGFRDR